jgi:hypothetical protein
VGVNVVEYLTIILGSNGISFGDDHYVLLFPLNLKALILIRFSLINEDDVLILLS